MTNQQEKEYTVQKTVESISGEERGASISSKEEYVFDLGNIPRMSTEECKPAADRCVVSMAS